MSLAMGLSMLTLLACLAKHSGSHWYFQFLSSILIGFFEFLVLRVNEINSSLSSSIIEFRFFIGPFVLLQLSIFFQLNPMFWP